MPTSSSCAKAAHPKRSDAQTASLKRLNPQATTDRPTLILLHGFRGAPQGLAAIADDLRAAGYTVQTPPVPPFAGAPALKSYTPDTYADYFAHYLKTQPFSRPVIIGHSMGSIVAAALAARYPDLIHSKLILLSPVSCRPAAGFAYLSKLPAFLPRRLVDFVTTSYLHTASSQASFRDLLQLTHSCSHDHSPRAADLLTASSFPAHHPPAASTPPPPTTPPPPPPHTQHPHPETQHPQTTAQHPYADGTRPTPTTPASEAPLSNHPNTNVPHAQATAHHPHAEGTQPTYPSPTSKAPLGSNLSAETQYPQATAQHSHPEGAQPTPTTPASEAHPSNHPNATAPHVQNTAPRTKAKEQHPQTENNQPTPTPPMPEGPTAAAFALAFFETLLIGADPAPFLTPALAAKKELLRQFLGRYRAAVLTEKTDVVGLVYARKARIFDVRRFRVTLKDGKIANITAEA